MNDILGIAIFVWAMVGIGCFIGSALLLAYAKHINTKTVANINLCDTLLAEAQENNRLAQGLYEVSGTSYAPVSHRIYQ